MIKKIVTFSLLFSVLFLISCSTTKDESLSRFTGSWIASEMSLDHALQGGEYEVIIQRDTLTVKTIGQSAAEEMTWSFIDPVISIESKEDPIIKAIVRFENNNMIWDRNGKLLYLIPKKQ